MTRTSFLPASRLEISLTLLEVGFGAWLYSVGYSGAAGLLVGGALAAFISRRMTLYHIAYHARQIMNASDNG